jgi:hypothetical protein
MRKTLVSFFLVCCAATAAMLSAAQTSTTELAMRSNSEIRAGRALAAPQTQKPQTATRRAGLWEISTNLQWQQTPFMPGAVSGIGEGGKHTKRVCLTQEMIDRDGALLPQSHGECRIENKVMRPGGITANWVCSGKISGTGALETNWIDLEHATGKLHFTGTFQGGAQAFPIEWTTESTSTFKSQDCGSVRPAAIAPAGRR